MESNTYWQEYINKLKFRSKYMHQNIGKYSGTAYKYIINFNKFEDEDIEWAMEHARKYCNEALCNELIEHCKELLKLPIKYRKDVFDYAYC